MEGRDAKAIDKPQEREKEEGGGIGHSERKADFLFWPFLHF